MIKFAIILSREIGNLSHERGETKRQAEMRYEIIIEKKADA